MSKMLSPLVGSTKSIANKNVGYWRGSRSGNRKSNGIQGVSALDRVVSSVSVKGRRGNGLLGRATRGENFPNNEGGGPGSP